MHTDRHGLAVTAASAEAAAAVDHAIAGYLKYRADTPKRLARALELDPEGTLTQTLKGYFTLLTYKAANLPVARDAHTAASRTAPKATAREQAHVGALGTWLAGDLDGALARWEAILTEHPHDILAFRLHHFNAFWLGRPDTMAASVERVLPAWSPSLPGYGTLLACRCFAHEELGNYTLAEAAGRQAIAIDPGDLWAAHAVAHILEMQGRRGEGIEWLGTLEPNWEGANNLAHHLWWHRGLYHFERREFGEVLALYDRRFRNLQSPLVVATPDLYIDVQNAASMLFRLLRQGVDVGDRWKEIADHAEARIGDCLSAFTLPHWMMALAAEKRWEAAGRLLDGMRTFTTREKGTNADIVREVALPVSEAVLAHGKGEWARACDLMRPVIGAMYRLGGSHAQQDVLEQLYLDAAVKAGSADDVRLLLERVAGRHPVPPERRLGYAVAARRLNA